VRRLLRLGDRPSSDPAVSGGKAAGLSMAHAAGLPVLPGWVLPTAEAEGAIATGAAVAAATGSAAARLAIADLELDGELRRELDEVGAELGPAIVRSSTVQESDPRWSGAFSTYAGVDLADLPAAIRGCWASAFTRDALARADAMGVPPASIRMAVLLQPWVRLDGGGAARMLDDGIVRVSAAAGRTEALVGGDADGAGADVMPDGGVVGDADLDGLGAAVLRRVADLARTVRRRTGHDAIEWGAAGGDVRLLQVGRSAGLPAGAGAPRTAGVGASRPLGRRLPAPAERLADLATRYPGPLAERLVLPWALAVRSIPSPPPADGPDAAEALAEALALARRLAASAWALSPARAEREASDTLRSVLGPDPRPGLERLSRLRPVDPGAAARVVALVGAVGRELVRRGAIPTAPSVWRLRVEEVGRATSGDPPPPRLGPDRWEPFAFAVAAANGEPAAGTPAAPGVGAGRLAALVGSPARWTAPPRAVLAVTSAAPQVAPLLWNAAGLVAARGNPGAHLFEVARSLGVPAVVGVDLLEAPPRAVTAVDGAGGGVWLLGDGSSGSAREVGA
jgi:hypothetical protein